MTYKTLSVSKEIYDLLSAIKKEGESFNDLFARLIKGNGTYLLSFYGKLQDGDEEINNILTTLHKIRKDENERID